jgi:predicted ATPase
MRPVLLRLDGFGSFREPAIVDFRDTEYFVLVGATGSGKSTVIDAMTFALYGSVPRWAAHVHRQVHCQPEHHRWHRGDQRDEPPLRPLIRGDQSVNGPVLHDRDGTARPRSSRTPDETSSPAT